MRFVYESISKKWREFRLKLWNEYYDPTLSKNGIINNVAQGLHVDQWALFANYRLKPETMVHLHIYLKIYCIYSLLLHYKNLFTFTCRSLQEKSVY